MADLMYGRRNRGLRRREEYEEAGQQATGLNAMAGVTRERAPAEQLGSVMDTRQMLQNLEADTFDARAVEAERAMKNIRDMGGRMAAQAVMGGGGDTGGNLADIAAFQTQNTRAIGMGAMQQFRPQTMANFRRRSALGNIMDAADIRNADQIREWAGMALNMEREDRAVQRDAMKWDYEMGRDARRDAMDERKFGLDVMNTKGAMQDRTDRLGLSERQLAGREEYQDAMAKSKRKAGKLALKGKQADLEQKKNAEIVKAYPGASPEARARAMQGDYSLLQKEYDEGEGDAMAPRPRITQRQTAATTKAAKELKSSQVAFHMKREGFDTFDMDPNVQAELTTAYNELLKENKGNHAAAARAAMQFVAPEKVFDADASRLGANPKVFNHLRDTQQWQQIRQAHMVGMEVLSQEVTGGVLTQDEAVAISMQKATSQYGPGLFGSTFQQGPDLVKQGMAKLAAADAAETNTGGAMAASSEREEALRSRRGKRGGKKAKRQQREAPAPAEPKSAVMADWFNGGRPQRRPRGNYAPDGTRRPDVPRRMPGVYVDGVRWEPRWSRQ